MDQIAIFKKDFDKVSIQRMGGKGGVCVCNIVFPHLGWWHHIFIYNLSHPAVETHLKHWWTAGLELLILGINEPGNKQFLGVRWIIEDQYVWCLNYIVMQIYLALHLLPECTSQTSYLVYCLVSVIG